MTRSTRFLRDKSRNGNYAWKTRCLSYHACPMGQHGLIDRPGMPLLSHTEGGRFITPRVCTVWISVRVYEEEARGKVWHSRRARASTSLSLRPSTPRMQGLDGMRLAYRSSRSYVERVVPIIFFFFFSTYVYIRTFSWAMLREKLSQFETRSCSFLYLSIIFIIISFIFILFICIIKTKGNNKREQQK